MNKFDEKYEFKFANHSDRSSLIDFIKKNWDKNHILATNPNFFSYEHENENNINFILAINKNLNRIEAIQGFIPYTKNIFKGHVCGVITCVSEKSKTPFLGIETMRRMELMTKLESYCGIGTNPKTMLPLVKKILKRSTGKMKHYFMLNPNLNEYKIANINQKILSTEEFKFSKNFLLHEIFLFSEVIKNGLDLSKKYLNIPYKDEWYIEKRYFMHPIYKYRIFIIKDKKLKSRSLLIAREININKSKLLRFVDFIGKISDLKHIGFAVNKILIDDEYEYIDFLCAGVEKDYLIKANFLLKKEDNDINIIPNYFEPLVMKNSIINYETNNKEMILFKADADQDRPRFT